MMISDKKAFMLVEVLITVVIVSVSAMLINHAFSSSLRAMSLSNGYRQAVMFLQNKSFDIDLDILQKQARDGSEQSVYMDENFSWQQTILPLERSDTGDLYDFIDLPLKRLSCLLAWGEPDSRRLIDLITYVYIKE
jgi:Tfp pilus assembly protein FimT